MGYIVPEYFKFPGDLSPSLGLKFSGVPSGLVVRCKVPLQGGAQVVFFAGLIETSVFFSGKSTGIGYMPGSTQTGEPGNYAVGFPIFWGKGADPSARKSKVAAELANVRLAMLTVIGTVFQNGLAGSAWGDWFVEILVPTQEDEGHVPKILPQPDCTHQQVEELSLENPVPTLQEAFVQVPQAPRQGV